MNMSKFVERLKELISEKGKNAKTVGEEIGCGNSTISHYLTGRYLPTVEMAIKLANYFNCTLDFLLGLTDENEVKEFKNCPPFKEQLPILCKKCNTSRYKISKKTGISESVLRYWAQGKTTPSIYNIARIAKELEISIDFVLGREN